MSMRWRWGIWKCDGFCFSPPSPSRIWEERGGWGLGADQLQSAQAYSPRQAGCGQSYLLEIGLLGLVWLVWLVWLQGTKGTNQPLGPTPCRVVPRAALSRVHESGLHLRLRLQTATAACRLQPATCTLHSHSYSTACPIQTTSPFQHPWAASPHRRIAAPRSYNIPGLSDIWHISGRLKAQGLDSKLRSSRASKVAEIEPIQPAASIVPHCCCFLPDETPGRHLREKRVTWPGLHWSGPACAALCRAGWASPAWAFSVGHAFGMQL